MLIGGHSGVFLKLRNQISSTLGLLQLNTFFDRQGNNEYHLNLISKLQASSSPGSEKSLIFLQIYNWQTHGTYYLRWSQRYARNPS